MYEELIKRLRYAASYDERIVIQDCKEAADAIEELQKQRDEWESHAALAESFAQDWIPVTERLPRMWEEVMLRFPNNQAVGFHDGDSGWAVFSGDNMYTYVAPEEVHPTHWMPLPEPPKEESNGV